VRSEECDYLQHKKKTFRKERSVAAEFIVGFDPNPCMFSIKLSCYHTTNRSDTTPVGGLQHDTLNVFRQIQMAARAFSSLATVLSLFREMRDMTDVG
jgi:hypothetical protein